MQDDINQLQDDVAQAAAESEVILRQARSLNLQDQILDEADAELASGASPDTVVHGMEQKFTTLVNKESADLLATNAAEEEAIAEALSKEAAGEETA
jgi:hypothetical protein